MNTKLALYNLVNNRDYLNRCLPFIKPEYFEEKLEQRIFSYISEFVTEYNTLPNDQVIEYNASSDKNLNDSELEEIFEKWNEIKDVDCDNVTNEWLYNITEEWCKERAIFLAVSESIGIITDEKNKHKKNEIPDLLKDALSVSFDTNVGHDFIEDSKSRYEYYHKKESKIPFDIDMLNKITKGGFTHGTLNLFLGGTNSGKTLFMCHLAAGYLKQGYNVLYITLEIAEELIAQRIDANLMDMKMADVPLLDQDKYLGKIDKIRKKTIGQLKIKQYPPAAVNINHFRALLNELNLKKNFNPDIIIIDYLGITASARIKSSENSFSYYKSVAEEMRGLAVERRVPIITNHQFNRSGQYNTDVDLENISESHGISMTADFMAAIIVSEEFLEEKKVMIKQLKSRYNDPNYYNKFMIGMDREKMRLYNLEDQLENVILEVDKEDTFDSKKPKVNIDFS
jgi:archaellum biogenesis ATPase FlaH